MAVFSKSTLKLNYLPKLSFGLDNTVRYKVEDLFGWGLRWVLQLTCSFTLTEICVLNKNLTQLNEKSCFYKKITQYSFIFNWYRRNLTTVQSLCLRNAIFLFYTFFVPWLSIISFLLTNEQVKSVVKHLKS